jgi:hypothetical protein
MNMGMVREVMDIIANGYGSIPTGLDRAIASRVVDYFYRKGWMNSQDIAYLVKAAGGEVRVSEEILSEDILLYWYDDPATGERVFQSRSKSDMVDNAKVNPDAESRVVDSGPIELTIVEKLNVSTDHNS